MDAYELRVLGYVRSPLTDPADAPRQGDEGAPDAVLELDPAVEGALAGLVPGDEVVVVTWLHLGDRGDAGGPPARRHQPPAHRASSRRGRRTGRTRSGCTGAAFWRSTGARLTVSGLEAVDGTPVVDVKIALGDVGDR